MLATDSIVEVVYFLEFILITSSSKDCVLGSKPDFKQRGASI